MIRTINRQTIALLSFSLLAASGCDQGLDQSGFVIDDEEDAEAIDAQGSAELTNAIGGVAQVPGFDVAIAKDGGDITLTWADQNAVDYEIWVSADPYFTPGDAGSSALVTGVTGLSYTHVGGNDQAERYYRLIATGVQDGISTTVGKLTYDLELGYTKLGMCLISEVDTSPELFADMESDLVSIHMWEGDQQVWASAWNGPWGELDFSVGEVISVKHDALGPDTYNMVGHVPVEADVSITLHPGDNLVTTLPLRFGDMQASDLLAMVPDASRIGIWDAANQVTQWYPDNGDFALPTCTPVHVEVTAESSWPPPAPAPQSSCPCDFSAAGLAEIGMNATNTCEDTTYYVDIYDVLWLEDTYGAVAAYAHDGSWCQRSDTAGFSEIVYNLSVDETADCGNDLDALVDSFDAPACTY